MKSCPKCKTPHSKPGIFCSQSCANSRVDSSGRRPKETREKISKALTGVKKNVTPAYLAATKKAWEKRKQNLLDNLLASEFHTLSIYSVRKKMVLENGYSCSACSISDWRGEYLPLELDHIDGNTKNNERANLRLLCPNCHSQTPTWRKAKKHPNWKVERLSGIAPELPDWQSGSQTTTT